MSFNSQWSVASGQWRTHAEQSAAAVQLLGQLLGFDPVVEHDSQGAPYLPERPDLHVSISHCRTAVAVAVSSESPIGIDIECRRSISNGLMARVCTPEERDAIHRSTDPVMTFLRYWTRKEAVLKCRGTGIRGFGSMMNALCDPAVEVREIETNIPDVVAAVAMNV